MIEFDQARRRHAVLHDGVDARRPIIRTSRRPACPLLNLLREPVPDDYDLDRYLNVLHETDRISARLFDADSRDRARRATR